MKAENTLQFMMDFQGDMFYDRQQCLDHLFCVIGNGYEWIDGELVEDSDSTRELLSRWNLKEDIEYAKPTKTVEEIGKIRKGAIKRRGITDNKWYPLSERYSYLYNYPDDIKPDWELLRQECIQMLRDDGVLKEN